MKKYNVQYCYACGWVHDNINADKEQICPGCGKPPELLSFTTEDVVGLFTSKDELDNTLQELKTWKETWGFIRQ